MVHEGKRVGEGKCQGKELSLVLNAAQESDHKRAEKHLVGGLGSTKVFSGLNRSKSDGVVEQEWDEWGTKQENAQCTEKTEKLGYAEEKLAKAGAGRNFIFK